MADADIVPGKYRKRPHLVAALFYNGNNTSAVLDWMRKMSLEHGKVFTTWCCNPKNSTMMVTFEDGDLYLEANNWLVFSHNKHFYMLPPDLFEDTYEIYHD